MRGRSIIIEEWTEIYFELYRVWVRLPPGWDAGTQSRSRHSVSYRIDRQGD